MLKQKNKNLILRKMHDVRLVERGGDLDFNKTERIKKKPIQEINYFSKTQEKDEKIFEEEKFFHQKEFYREKKNFLDIISDFSKKGVLFGAPILIFIFFFNFINQGLILREDGLVKGQSAFQDIELAGENLKKGDFQNSHLKFEEASQKLAEISFEIDKMGGFLVGIIKHIPYLSKISSATYLVEAGEEISQIGILVSGIFSDLEKNKIDGNNEEKFSYLELFKSNESKLREISQKLNSVQDNINKVNLDDVPKENQEKIIEIKKILPEINFIFEKLLQQEKILVDVLGGNGPRKYLFLFQNNQEMRATGGFIGSYGMLDIFEGKVRKFFIDGIYNPDGQLREKVIPPAPIQKISAAWSLHDSNWFPDFPKSAEKAIWFYEKTGGPTVDGIVAITPTVMQKLLEITGPIEMEEYQVTIDKDNFIEKIQYEVEINYDKELNQPKKILGDLAPKILEKILNNKNINDIKKIANILIESLDERQIILYSENWQIQKMFSDMTWSGEILSTPKDYLSVINTNINGFKTDGIVEEKIFHKAEIQEDGSIVDTVKIVRHHKGGDSEYEWWNKVNSNYMRVYVPKGSKLLSAEGHTREFNLPVLDYRALGFKKDAQVEAEESFMQIDESTGTRIYEDSDKTVFGNWVYVSPKETVVVEYKYLLPFKISFDDQNTIETYSLLAQKQAGSFGSQFFSQIYYPKNYNILWKFPEKNMRESFSDSNLREIATEEILKKDYFIGLAFSYAQKN